MSRAQKLLTIVILAGFAAAVYAAVLRWRVEMPNRATALILDWQEVQALAAAEGIPAADALQQLRQAGASAVAFGEQHLSDLVAAGQVAVLPMAAAGLEPEPAGEGIVLSAYEPATAERLRAYLFAKLPGAALASPPGATEQSALLVPVRASGEYLEMIGLGWPEEGPALASEAGMGVAVRLENYPGARDSGIVFMAAQASAAGAHLVIFGGDQVLGYPGLVDETAQVLTAAGLTYGSVELTKQLGDERLGRALGGSVVRVHSITEPEMITMSPATAVARYVRAVRERGVRACYLRLFLAPRAHLLQFNRGYISQLKRELAAVGYDIGAPRPLAPVRVPMWAVWLVAAGVVAAAVFALGSMAPLAEWLAYLLFVLGLGLGAALFVVSPELARAEKALLAAVVFPAIGLIAAARGARTLRAGSGVSSAGLAARAAGWLIGVSAISIAGGMMVAGLLTERLYMTQVLQFRGVKLALALPLLVAGAVWVLGLYAEDWGAYRRRVQDNFRRVWNRPTYVWEVVLAAGLLGAAAAMLMRSGNEPGVGVSGLEMRARGILEQIFLARPRTKEFLVGHPALMLGLAVALRGRRRWVLLLLLLGAVGQASLVNTFVHLHTPLLMSLLRSAHGLWLGLALGAILVWVWDRVCGAAGAETGEQQTTGS